MSKKLKEELKKLASTWNASGEHDETEFEGRYFIGDAELDEFAEKHSLGAYDHDDQEIFISDYRLIEEKCECRLNCDYDENHGNRQFYESEVIFNEKNGE